MKIKSLLYILFPMILISCSNDEISEDQAASFMKFYGNSIQNLGTDIKPLPDNGYVVLGSINDPDNGYQVHVMKTDEYGNLKESPITLGGPLADYGYALQVHENGTVYIVGSTVSEANGTTDMVLHILNDEITSITYGKEGNEVGYHLQIIDDRIIMIGYTDSNRSSKDVYIVYANRNGDVIWTREFGGKTGEDIGRYVIPFNGGFLFTGTTNYDSQLNVRNNKNIWLVQTNEQVKQINSVSIGGAGDDYGVGLLPTPEGSVYLAGTMYDTQLNKPVVYISKFDESLKKKWESTYPGLDAINTSDIDFWNGNIIVAGTNAPNENSSRIAVFTMTVDGDLLNEQYVGAETKLSVSTIEPANDQGVIMAGTNEYRGSSVITILKLNELGNL